MLERSLIVWLLSFLASTSLLLAQSPPRESYFSASVLIEAASNFSAGSIVKFDNSFDCGEFRKGRGISPIASLELETVLYYDLSAACEFSLTNRSLNFALTSEFPSRGINDLKLTTYRSRVELKTKNRFLEIGVGFKYLTVSYLKRNNLYISPKFLIALPLNLSFEETENIISPSNAYFLSSGGKRRTISQGETPNSSDLKYGLKIGLENSYKSLEQLEIICGLDFGYFISDISRGIDWKIVFADFGIGLKFNILKPPPKTYTTPIIDENEEK